MTQSATEWPAVRGRALAVRLLWGTVVLMLAGWGTPLPASAADSARLGELIGPTAWEPAERGGMGLTEAIAYTPRGELLSVEPVSLPGPGGSFLRLQRRVHVGASGALRPVPGGCLTAVSTAGCGLLPALPADVRQIVVAPDQRAVHLVGDGVLTLAMDPVTGAITPLPDGSQACLGSDGTFATCGDQGPPWSVEQPRSDAAYAWHAGRFDVLSVDPQTGAIRPPTGGGSCLSLEPVDGCGATSPYADVGVVGGPGGRDVYGQAGGAVGQLRVTGTSVTDTGQAVRICADACPGAGLLLPADGRHVYVPGGPVFARDAATGQLAPASCQALARCGTFPFPAVASPDGHQIYAITPEAITRGTSFWTAGTWQRDPQTGAVSAQSWTHTVAVGPGGNEGAPAPTLAVSPFGEWLSTSAFSVLRRRSAPPPTVTFSGLPRRCARGPVRVTVRVAGGTSARYSTVAADSPPPPDVGFGRHHISERRFRSTSARLAVPPLKRTTVRVVVEVAGPRYNDATVTRSFRFC